MTFVMVLSDVFLIMYTVTIITGGVMHNNRKEYARHLYTALVEYMDSLANPQNFQRLNDAIMHLNEESNRSGFPDVGRELKILAFQISEARGQIVMLLSDSGDRRVIPEPDDGLLSDETKKLLRDIVDIANCIAAMILELSELCEANESSREICSFVLLVNEVVVEAIAHLRHERAAIAALLERLLRSSDPAALKSESICSRFSVDVSGRIVYRVGNSH